MIVRYGYNAYLIYQYNQQNYNVTTTPLALMNFTESYIVHYNQGNLFYKCGNYEEAIRSYKKTLALHVPKKKECDVRVNLALAMLGTIKDTYKDLSYAEQTMQVLLAARDVLLEEECAKDDGEGHDEEAQKLKEEIDKMIENLQNQQSGNDNSGEDPNESEDDPQEQGSNDPKEQESEEQQAQAEQKKQREEMMKNQLKEKQERAAQEREDELSYVRGFEEEYNFLNEDPIW